MAPALLVLPAINLSAPSFLGSSRDLHAQLTRYDRHYEETGVDAARIGCFTGIWRLRSVKCANKPGVQAKQSVHCCRHDEAEALIVHLLRPMEIRVGFNLCAADFDQPFSQAYAKRRLTSDL